MDSSLGLEYQPMYPHAGANPGPNTPNPPDYLMAGVTAFTQRKFASNDNLDVNRNIISTENAMKNRMSARANLFR